MTTDTKPYLVAVIPARAGSKRLPNKNLMNLAGKRLVEWTIEAAISANVFDEIILTTDSAELLAVGEQYSIISHQRPAQLSGDNATTLEAILDSVEHVMQSANIVLLQPTSPLRTAAQIIQSIEKFNIFRGNCLVSVCEIDHPIEWTGFINNHDQFVNHQLGFDTRSQDLPKRYRLNGAIYITTLSRLREGHPLISAQPLSFVMDRRTSVDIDELVDFKLAEQLLIDETSC